MLFMIVLVHELGHGLAASYYKWPIYRLMILPFGGELETDAFGHRPWKEEVYVVLAGPFQHVLLFFIAFILNQFNLFTGQYYDLFQQMNMMILVVNLLPALPLDGGKLVFLMLARMQPFILAHAWTIKISLIFTFIFMGLIICFAPWHMNSWMLASFLLFSIWKDRKQHRFYFLRFLLNKGEGTKIKQLTLSGEVSVMAALEHFLKNKQHEVIVKENGKTIGMITESQLLHTCFALKQPFVKLKELAHPQP